MTGWPEKYEQANLKPYYIRRHELSCEQNCVMWGSTVIIPQVFREKMLKEFHWEHQNVRSSPPSAPLIPWKWATRPFQRIHIDFCQMGGDYFLVVVVSHSKWIEVKHFTSHCRAHHNICPTWLARRSGVR